MKDWEKYETQIIDKLSDEFPHASILKNQKIKGIFSKRSRQIDILVKASIIGKSIIGVIDCKKFGKKIDVKAVESFIGFLEDVGANLGVMITNIGYTKSAMNRVTNYVRDIKLDIVEFDNFEEYHFNWDVCNLCKDEDQIAKGEIIWENPQGIVKAEKVTIVELGECSYCGEPYIKCQACGEIGHLSKDDNDFECQCGNIFGIESVYIGSGMTEERIILKSNYGEKPEFIDPNQMRLF